MVDVVPAVAALADVVLAAGDSAVTFILYVTDCVEVLTGKVTFETDTFPPVQVSVAGVQVTPAPVVPVELVVVVVVPVVPVVGLCVFGGR